MKSLKFSLVLCILLSSNTVAGLPDVTQEELADLLQVQDDRVRVFQIKYRLNQGAYSEDGELMPDVEIDCEFGHDISKGHRYLHEKWVNHSSGNDLERQYTYDGKRGMSLTLKQPDDPGRTYGRIMAGAPDELSEQAIWKPGWSEYGFIKESDTLSGAIRNSRRIEVTTEKFNGEELYRVTFTTKEFSTCKNRRTAWSWWRHN